MSNKNCLLNLVKDKNVAFLVCKCVSVVPRPQYYSNARLTQPIHRRLTKILAGDHALGTLLHYDKPEPDAAQGVSKPKERLQKDERRVLQPLRLRIQNLRDGLKISNIIQV